MRRLFVKIFNLIYIIGAGLSMFALATRPMLNVTVQAKFSDAQVGAFVTKAIGADSRTQKKVVAEILSVTAPAEVGKDKVLGTSEVSVEVKYTDNTTATVHPESITLDTSTVATGVEGTVRIGELSGAFFTNIVAEGGAGGGSDASQSKSISEVLTEEKVRAAFKNGLTFKTSIKVESKYAFNFKNKAVIKTILDNNILTVLDSAIDSVTGPLHSLLKDVAKEIARDTLRNEVMAQVNSLFNGPEATVTDEQVDQIFDTVYSTIDGQEASLQELANALIGKDENGNPVEGTNVLSILDELYEKSQDPDSGVSLNANITNYEEQRNNINSEQIADQLAISLSTVPGLVEGTGKYYLANPQPNEAQIKDAIKSESEPNFYFNIPQGSETFVRVTEYDPSATNYYKEELKVNDVDAALAAIISSMTNSSSGSSSSSNEGDGNKAIMRKTRAEGNSSSTEDSKVLLRNALKDYLYKVIPVNKITNVTAKFDPYVPYILLGILAIFMLPWFVFLLVTLFRTLGRDRIWTTPFAILFWTFIQLILGIVLTYGSKYIIPLVGKKVPKIQTYLSWFTLDIRTGCLIPAFVFCGFVVMLIPYLILTKPYRRAKKIEQRNNRRRKRYDVNYQQ